MAKKRKRISFTAWGLVRTDGSLRAESESDLWINDRRIGTAIHLSFGRELAEALADTDESPVHLRIEEIKK